MAQGVTRFFLGEFDAACALFEKGRVGDPKNRHAYSVSEVEDFYALTLSWLGSTLTNLGHLDQARTQRDMGIQEARRHKRAHTLVFVLSLACWLDWGV